jgi:hypothetical protein
VRQQIHGRASGGVDPVLGNPVAQCLLAHRGVQRVEEHLALSVEQLALVGDRGSGVDAV